MLRRILGRLSFVPFVKGHAQEYCPGSLNGEIQDKSTPNAEHGALEDAGANDVADEGGGENDWDEYEDEIAGAVAFAAWQDASTHEWVWEEEGAEIGAELLEVHGSGEQWEDWAAVDELEDDASYHWDEEEGEEN